MTNKKFVITPSILNGEVSVSGAKNSVLKLLSASLLTDDDVILRNYPASLSDAEIHRQMLIKLGKVCTVNGSTLHIKKNKGLQSDLTWNDRSIRSTLLMLGSILTRNGNASVPLPGGCKLGERKYDIHVYVLESLGAKVWGDDEFLYASCEGRLKGAEIHLSMRSTGATENAILASSLAEGVTNIWNPHIRPEVLDLISMLNSMGAKIKVFGQERIEVHGVKKLSGTNYEVMPDNMEALTWAVGASITGGTIKINNFPFEHLEVPLIYLRESGCVIFKHGTTAIITGSTPFPLDISTGPYPGINSDMQPILAAYASCAQGISNIVDLRFIGRYAYAEQFEKMGVETEIIGNMLKITGKGKGVINAANVIATDLRAGISLALLALCPEAGETTISNAWQIERGYDNFVTKFEMLGGNIRVI
jgi:UDP-N-acetylglucosamine 1-carboxyvinyltransferase